MKHSTAEAIRYSSRQGSYGPGAIQIQVPSIDGNELKVRVTHDIHVTDENGLLVLKIALAFLSILFASGILICWYLLSMPHRSRLPTDLMVPRELDTSPADLYLRKKTL